jgi:nickel-dependent lactate racemase
MQKLKLQTGIWYNDHTIELGLPDTWSVTTCNPSLPGPMSNGEIRQRIDAPVNQAPLRQLAKGKKRPVVVIDDLDRPTPVFRILPFVLDEFQAAGIGAEDVRILVATGTHGKQNEEALANKIGPEAFGRCRVIVHNYKKNTQFIGNTSFGTPVHVNREALDCDLLCGIGGIYPQHTTGFGGGSKLALGILGRKSIVHLHFGGHGSVGGTYNIDNPFREDLEEIARMIGLNALFTLHIDARLNIVNLFCGDHFSYYPQAAQFSRTAYDAPLPHDADVVIANTYPSDVSYTFMRKGMKPLRCAPQSATKIAIGYNHEGVGRHGIFPQGGNPRIDRLRALILRISTMERRVIFQKIKKHLVGHKEVPGPPVFAETKYALPDRLDNLLLYRPEGVHNPLPEIDGMRIVNSWQETLEIVGQRHFSSKKLRVYVYPCASLQCLDHLKLFSKKCEQNESIVN